VVAGGIAIFIKNYLEGNTFNRSNNVVNTQPSANPNNSVPIQNCPLNYLRNYEGKDPYNVKIFETEPLKARLIKLLGDKYIVFLDNMRKSAPIINRNEALFTSGFLRDNSVGEEAAISILLNTDNILVGIINNSKHTFYSEKHVTGELPQDLKTWFDTEIKSTQDNLVKLHRYNYTGIVKSVEEQGNRGMTYLSITTIDGKEESFLINGAKIYRADNEVNSSQLTKGINVGVIGGDEAKRIDILPTSLKQGRFPYTSERLLVLSDLSGMSKGDLKIMRNEIFARHGYIFRTPDMKSYFSQQAWYRAQNENVTSFLTEIEKQNIGLIKKYE
jgi:hypothetical protein